RCPVSCGGISLLQGNIAQIIDESQELSDFEHEVNQIRQEIFAFETMSTKLATQASKDKQPPSLDDILKGPYADFSDVFSDEGVQHLPPHRDWDHAIDLKPDWQKWRQCVYPLNPKEQIELDKFLSESLDK